MKCIDLTFGVQRKETHISAYGQAGQVVRNLAKTVRWPVNHGATRYTALFHHLNLWSMSGTYIDFPGHLTATDDGLNSDNYPLAKLYRVKAAVIHLNRRSGSGAISKEELAAACPPLRGAKALIGNALGARRVDAIEHQSVYLSGEAVGWIARRRVHLLVSDVYESACNPQNVFHTLFDHGVSTVCCPINLSSLKTPLVRLTVLPLKLPGAVQAPCRVVAEWE